MGVATVFLWMSNYIVTQSFTMMDEDPWLVEKFHNGFPFCLYGIMCVALFLFVLRFVPETKGKTLEQIDRYWGKTV